MIRPALPTVLTVGLDLAQRDFAACLLLWDRHEPLPRRKLPNSPAGVTQLTTLITTAAAQQACTAVRIGMEATGAFWQPLTETLRAEPALQALALELFLLNPREIAAYKACFAPQPKTDLRDAYLIADYIRDGKARHALPPQDQLAPLQVLTRHRLHVVETLVREKNRLLTLMFRKFSRLVQDSPLTKLFGATSLALLSDFHTLDEIATLSLPALADFLRHQGRGRIADVETVATAIQALATQSFRVPEALVSPLNFTIQATLATLALLTRQLREVDKVIGRTLRGLPAAARLQSVPGLGPVFSAGILAELGDITRFAGHPAVAKYAGLVWLAEQSGDFEAEEPHLTVAGNRYLRYYFIEGANSVRVHAEEYGAYYQRKYAEVAKHQHKRALVLTARKLIRLVYLLVTTDRMYLPPSARYREVYTPATF
jgi:transposase